MAKYFLYVKVFSRGKGSRVTRAAAYRAGERIRDERTSEVYNYGPDLPVKVIRRHSGRDATLRKPVRSGSCSISDGMTASSVT